MTVYWEQDTVYKIILHKDDTINTLNMKRHKWQCHSFWTREHYHVQWKPWLVISEATSSWTHTDLTPQTKVSGHRRIRRIFRNHSANVFYIKPFFFSSPAPHPHFLPSVERRIVYRGAFSSEASDITSCIFSPWELDPPAGVASEQ